MKRTKSCSGIFYLNKPKKNRDVVFSRQVSPHEEVRPSLGPLANPNPLAGIKLKTADILFTDSQTLTFGELSGLVCMFLEEQLKFGRPKTGGDDEMSHIVQTRVRMGAGGDRRDVSGPYQGTEHWVYLQRSCNSVLVQQHGESLEAPGVQVNLVAH